MKSLKRFDWTDTQHTETEEHAVEKILFEYHDIFARQTMDLETNTEFKNETHTERWQSCLQPKSADADPPERKLSRWTRPNAQIRDFHSPNYLKIC